MIRITQVINNLQTGGAEMMLLRLMERLDRDRFEPSVITMIGEGTVGPKLRELDVPVVALGASRRRISLGTLFGVRRHLRALQPDVIQAWMYHSNLAAYLSRGAVKGKPALAWNIRHSLHDLQHEGWLTRRVIMAGARRSRRVDAVISNSRVSLDQHESIGYRSPRNVVIPNGFDLSELGFSEEDRVASRRSMGMSEDSILVGGIGRNHPMKDHESLVRMVRQLHDQGHDVHCVLAGRGLEPGGDAETLRQVSGLGPRLHLMPEIDRVSGLLSALDVFVVSSRWGEGFPNVLAEAMACEVPCIATDVGDVRYILEDPDRIVPPGDVSAMTNAVGSLLERTPEERRSIGCLGRKRIEDNFQIEAITHQYQDLWSSLAESGGQR